MMNFIRNLKAAFSVARAEVRREEGQGTFEWLLLIGVVVVVLITATAAQLWDDLVLQVFTAMGAAITALF